MNFDKWFYKQSTLVKIILLILPFVGWICECFIRLSIALRENTTFHWVVFAIFVAFGEFWVLGLIDLIYFLINGHLLFADSTPDAK